MESANSYDYRKKIGLPVTKKLFYKNYEGVYEIKDFFIVKEFKVSDYWAILKLKFDNHESVRIHSMFLKEMQKKKFDRKLFYKDIEE